MRITTAITTNQSTPPPPPPTPGSLSTLSSIAAGKQSLGTPMSASSRSKNVQACLPTLLLPCFGSHKTRSLKLQLHFYSSSNDR